MDQSSNIILSQIPLEEIVNAFRQVVREEIAAARIDKDNSLGAINGKPFTTKKLCEHLGVTEPTIIRWRKKKVIPFFRIGSAVRFHLPKVLEALEKQGKKI